ncbi:hypothetical protein C6V80_09650 [Caminibacter pacificus]|uniref:Uncharacterized protein n=1 Tax=Caminibacter pacificus TaxID=1424653 RepID=A0ABX5VVZ9_9BACT|nr:hypothetical protein [Caminibacter pacificus]QDD68103.1 hypothetical protein C6V80_09650 [Caminibacter pacificus]
MSDFKAYIKKCEYGWIEFYINDIKIYISFAYNPLFEIKESLEKLICGCENITFEIDEEGNEKRFEFFYSKPYWKNLSVKFIKLLCFTHIRISTMKKSAKVLVL